MFGFPSPLLTELLVDRAFWKEKNSHQVVRCSKCCYFSSMNKFFPSIYISPMKAKIPQNPNYSNIQNIPNIMINLLYNRSQVEVHSIQNIMSNCPSSNLFHNRWRFRRRLLLFFLRKVDAHRVDVEVCQHLVREGVKKLLFLGLCPRPVTPAPFQDI